MDMHCSLVQEITNSYDEFEDEDDVFYEELRRQVLQLTADDEELYPNVRSPSSVDARRKGLSTSPPFVPQCRCHYNWTENHVTPPWLLSLWKTNGKGNGTGVFIPQIVKSSRRRNYRPRRKNNERGKMQKLVEKN
ncbi:unnamed protein product [Fraxinus pennsylvanica]|uniref:Uncharacterized protein n=1 Tax=Fraxinus pennsylvanica TaxID=56036 RepID=A0AAD1ZT94_9LAMI|nr:unnamed protein product [Fraxinus pennsylvanica]